MPQSEATVRVAIDIGGTFTDVVAVRGGELTITKVLSTPDDLSRGVVDGVGRALEALGALTSDVSLVIHATTAATNALLERRGAKVGLVVTEGFRDVLELGRQRRYDPYDLRRLKLEPLVTRDLVVEVPERVAADGSVLRELDEAAVREANAYLREQGVEAIAVSFLHSYRNADHERRAKGLIGNGIPVFASHEIIPEAREYERTSTTVIASYLAPVVANYLAALSRRLESIGAPSQFWVMKSSGGLFSSEAARSHPEELVESGPAAGVIGAAAAGRDLGISDLIAFDMGGTTAKASLVRDGKPGVNYEYEVGGAAHAGGFLRKGTGYPLRVPVLDIAEVGTGGGSIAWVDSGGALRVGPTSAGAVPGPACYGLGGTKPTVTDADLVLGYLDARSSAQYLGTIDRDKARAAIDEHVARPLGLSIEAAALGIFDLANAQMTDAVRLVSVAKGFDTRELALVAFGGAGPLHAWAIARELGIASVLIPAHPGVFSAVGLLWADFRIDRSRGVRFTLGAPGTAEAMPATLAELGASAEAEARAQGAASDVIVQFSGDLRYVGQSYELNVPIESSGAGIDAEALRATFNREHARVYGHASETEPLEVIALRATATLPGDRRRFEDRAVAASGTESHRPIVFAGGEVQARVVDRASLDTTGVAGPAAVVQVDTTTIVPPGARIARATNGFLILHVSEEAS